jgi:hypothetical protein
MLDLTVAMFQFLLALMMLIFQETPTAITSPKSGEILRGQVNIAGNMNVTNFASAELSFAYASDPTSTWFTIQTFSTPLTSGEGQGVGDVIAYWDTTTLTDDDYRLRLRVNLQDGSFQEFLVTDLKIRNDVPVATETPTLTPTSEPEFALETPLPTSTPVPVPTRPVFPTPTSLPVNPASLTTHAINLTFGRGALLALAVFFVFGLFLRLRRS